MTAAFTARAYPSVIWVAKNILLICGGKREQEEFDDILIYDCKLDTSRKIAKAPFGFHCPNQSYFERESEMLSLVSSKQKGL